MYNYGNYLLNRLVVLHGAASDAEARVYARLPALSELVGGSLRGTISGPFCRYAHTLPSAYPMVDCGPGDVFLAEAILPDPCFWTSESPYWYKVSVELLIAGKPVAKIDRAFGIRRLATDGRNFIFDGKRWVMRAVQAHRRWLLPAGLKQCREQGTTIYCHQPADGLLREAGEAGCVLIVTVADSEDVLNAVRQLSRWTAVAGVVLPSETLPIQALRMAAPNILFGQQYADNVGAFPARWAQFAMLDEDRARKSPPLDKPTVVCRPRIVDSIETGRKECDLLQRDLAGVGDFAGYLVQLETVG